MSRDHFICEDLMGTSVQASKIEPSNLFEECLRYDWMVEPRGVEPLILIGPGKTLFFLVIWTCMNMVDVVECCHYCCQQYG